MSILKYFDFFTIQGLLIGRCDVFTDDHYSCKVDSACARAAPVRTLPYCGYTAPPTIACASSRSDHCYYRPECQENIKITIPCEPTPPEKRTKSFTTGTNCKYLRDFAFFSYRLIFTSFCLSTVCVGKCLYKCNSNRFTC